MTEDKLQKKIKGILEHNKNAKGKTFEEIYGVEKAREMREKMSKSHTGAKRPWNSVPDRVGEKSPRWYKDRTKLKRKDQRNDPAYKVWRKTVWVRDNFVCQLKSEDCKGRIISHHILPWRSHTEARYDVNNGITLCHYHHPRKMVDEKRLEPIFLELVQRQGK